MLRFLHRLLRRRQYGIAFQGIGHCALWDLSTQDYVQDMFRQIRQTGIDTLTPRLERIWNDQTVDDPRFEPYQVARSSNKLTNDGLVRVAELVTNSVGLNTGFTSTSGYFSHFACGSGTNPASASDYQLQAEVARVALADSGFMTAAGSFMRYGGNFSPTTVSATLNENGVFDDPNAGIMLFRSVFPAGQVLTHTVNVDYFTMAHTVYEYSV